MAPIYVKSVYSFLSSTITIDDYITFAMKNNYKNLCLCDDNMYGVMEFIKKCQSNSINPIIGVDFNNILLFAKNYDGYINLLHLSKIKSEKEIEISDFKNYNSNLICFIKKDNENITELQNIFNDNYVYSTLKNDKDYFYLHKTLCLNSQDLETIKYLNMLRDNKTVLDNYEFDSDICFINYDDKRYQEFFDKCNLELPNYKLNIPDFCK